MANSRITSSSSSTTVPSTCRSPAQLSKGQILRLPSLIACNNQSAIKTTASLWRRLKIILVFSIIAHIIFGLTSFFAIKMDTMIIGRFGNIVAGYVRSFAFGHFVYDFILLFFHRNSWDLKLGAWMLFSRAFIPSLTVEIVLNIISTVAIRSDKTKWPDFKRSTAYITLTSQIIVYIVRLILFWQVIRINKKAKSVRKAASTLLLLAAKEERIVDLQSESVIMSSIYSSTACESQNSINSRSLKTEGLNNDDLPDGDIKL